MIHGWHHWAIYQVLMGFKGGFEMRKAMRLMVLLIVVVSTFVLPYQKVTAASIEDIAWRPLDCGAGDPFEDENPDAVDLVGDTANGFYSAYYAYDETYLYLRHRVNGNASGTDGFSQYAWTMLLNVPSGSAYEYQYMVSLNGNNSPGYAVDTVELWTNTLRDPIDWTPIFRDYGETNLWKVVYTNSGPFGGKLASTEPAGSTLGNYADYFVSWAIPVDTLISNGVITTWTDLEKVLFFPATATDPNQYNKDYLNCPFLPRAELTIQKSVTPEIIDIFTGGTPKPWDVTYTFAVSSVGTTDAIGVVLEDAFSPFTCIPNEGICLDIKSISYTIGPNSGPVAIVTPASLPGNPPLKITANRLAAGEQLIVQVVANVEDYGAGTYLNTATTYATNASEVQDTAVLLLNPDPTAVELARFEAVAQDDGILIEWETATEVDNLGFNLYRSTAANGEYVLLNGALIPTQVPGAVFGATYTWLDDSAVPGVTYFYKLEDVNIEGQATLHGPIQATALSTGPSAVSLTAFSAGGGSGLWLPLALSAMALLGGLRRRK